jgi:integrase
MADGLTGRVLDSGLGLRKFAHATGSSVRECTETVLWELESTVGLPEEVLEAVDHGAARVFAGSGDPAFDRFVTVALALHAVSLGMGRREEIWRMSMELIDPLAELRSRGGVTRDWLSALITNRFRSDGRIFRFGNLTRIALIVAERTGFHDLDPIFEWARENECGIESAGPQQWTRVMTPELCSSGYPGFDLWVITSHGEEIVRRVPIDTDSRLCRKVLRESVQAVGDWGQAQHLRDPFFSGFSEGLGYVPKSLSEFTVEGFSRQLEWLDERPDSTAKSYRYLRRFYKRVIDLLPEGQGQFTFATGLPPQLLDHHHLFEFWRKGYRGVLHNPLDPVPDNDRWFLFPSRDELARTNVSPIPAAMDLSYDDADMRRVLKEWLWRECDNVYYVRRLAPRLKRFFDVVRESPGWAPPIREIGLRPVVEYITARSEEVGASGVRHAKGWLRSILRYGEATGAWAVDGAAYLYLESSEKSDRWAPDESAAVPLEDLGRVLDELESRAERSLFDRCVYTAICVQSLTPLRIGDILSLRRSDLRKAKDGVTRYVDCSTKTDIYGKRQVQIPRLAGQLIDALAEMTEELSKDPREGINGRVFLYPGHSIGFVGHMDSFELGRHIDSACDAVGVKRFNPRNVRRRYETEVVLRGIRHNLSRLALRPLTGHSSLDVTERYYVRDDIREYLEAVHGIEIGSPDLRGDVDDWTPDDVGEEDSVEGGAGFCRRADCDVAGTVTCLMCPGFVTSPERIPEMEAAVRGVNDMIRAAGANQHERDHLLAVKRLYLAYLARMYQLKEAADACR